MLTIAGLVLDYRDSARTRACIDALRGAGVTRVQIWDNTENACATPATYGFDESGCVRVAGAGRNLGFAAGANLGIALCRGNWPGCKVLLVNNDALVSSTLAASLLDALESDQHVAIAFPLVRQSGKRVGWMWYQPWLCMVGAHSIPWAMRYASGCCQLIDPERTGEAPFNQDFFMYGEDVELAWRLRGEGWTQKLVETEEVVHEGSASSRNGSYFYESRLVDAHLRLAVVFSGGKRRRLIALLMLRLLVLPLRALVRSFRLRNLTPIRALMNALIIFGNGSSRSKP